MSKATRPLTTSKLPADQRSYEPLVKDARPDIEVHRDVLRQLAENRFSELPREIASFLDAVAQSCVDVYWPARAKGARLTRPEVARMMRSAVHEGYLAAMMDYSADIQQSDEASAQYDKREIGGHKGHKTQSEQREARYKKIRETQARLEAEGKPCTYEAVAKECGYSRATVERAINRRTTNRMKR